VSKNRFNADTMPVDVLATTPPCKSLQRTSEWIEKELARLLEEGGLATCSCLPCRRLRQLKYAIRRELEEKEQDP